MEKNNYIWSQCSSWFPLLELDNVLNGDNHSGVYMIGLKLSEYIEPQIVYIGSSKNLKYRLKQHTHLNSIPDLLVSLYQCIPRELFVARYILIDGKENYFELEDKLIKSTWGTLNTLKRDNESIYVAYDRAVASLKEIIRTAEQLHELNLNNI